MTRRRFGAQPEPYLAGLMLTGRRVVVLGAGTVASRRVGALVDAGASVEVIAPQASASVRAAAGAGDLLWHQRSYRRGDLDQAWYVLVATDDAEANRTASTEAEQDRVFCVRADDRYAASAWTPATAQVDGVTVGVLSGGDPRRSRRIRDLVVAALTGTRRSAA